MIHIGDCLDILPMLESNSIDSCVCDPPYGLNFMNKKWDHDVPSVDIWKEVYRVLKPGAHLLAFFGTRTYRRGVVNIEDAGFEIRDQIGWGFLSGFPKSHNVSKAIDKHLGVERQVLAEGKPVKRMIPGADQDKTGSWIKDNGRVFVPTVTAAGSNEAARWEGWGSALKPSREPIVMARKPLVGTLAQNTLAYGVGGLNIDASRIPFLDAADEMESKTKNQHGDFGSGPMTNEVYGKFTKDRENYDPDGRWPANMLHDGVFTELFGEKARIFFCAKASKSDRNDGLDEFEPKPSAASEFRPNHAEKAAEGADGNPYGRWKPLKNNHPTVKPTDLMRYLCRLVTPPGGTVLDPFMGSGSTGRGAALEGFGFIGIELDAGYAQIAEARIAAAEAKYIEEAYA